MNDEILCCVKCGTHKNEGCKCWGNSDREEVARKSMLAFNLWVEGYRCTGGSGRAKSLGLWDGVDFSDACQNWASTTKSEHYNENNNTIWGCRIYDNETSAKVSFG